MKEISLDILVKIFKKNFLRILIITLIVMLLVATVTHFFIPKTYSSSVKFYVVNTPSASDYTSSSVVSAATYLINDYIAIIKSDKMLQTIVDHLKKDGITDVTAAQVNSMIVGSAAKETSVFTISVSSTDKELAHKVASIIEEIAPIEVTNIAKSAVMTNERLSAIVHNVIINMQNLGIDKKDVNVEEIESYLTAWGQFPDQQTNCIEPISHPVLDTQHDSPNLVVYTLVGGLLAAIITYVVYAVRVLTNQSVTTEEDVKKMLKRPLIAVIPHWETTQKN